jgi:hypothetical protein
LMIFERKIESFTYMFDLSGSPFSSSSIFASPLVSRSMFSFRCQSRLVALASSCFFPPNTELRTGHVGARSTGLGWAADQ